MIYTHDNGRDRKDVGRCLPLALDAKKLLTFSTTQSLIQCTIKSYTLKFQLCDCPTINTTVILCRAMPSHYMRISIRAIG